MRVVTIEAKPLDAAKSAAQLRQVLRERGVRAVTAAEASALSGLPLHLARPALLQLASELPAEISADDEGGLRVTFEALESERDRRRPPGPIRRWFRANMATLQGWATLLMAAVLVISFGTALNGIGGGAPLNKEATMTAAAGVGFGLAMIGGLFLVVMGFPPFLLAGMALVGGQQLADGEPGQAVATLLGGGLIFVLSAPYVFKMARWLTGGGRLWPALRGLIFGPPRERVGALDDERDLTALIGARDGTLSALDVIGLFGWTHRQADRELVRILLDYGGELLVTDEGAIVYRFPALAATEAEAPAAAWQRPEPAPSFFGCSPTAARATLIVFGVAALTAVLNPAEAAFPPASRFSEIAAEHGAFEVLFRPGFGAYPYALLALIFALRAPPWWRRVSSWRQRRRLLRLIEVAQTAPAEGAEIPSDLADPALLAELHGDIDVERGAAGTTWVRFPELARARAAAGRIRAEGVPRDAVRV